MLKRNLPYCLVLAGGGAKGVYHIGAWKALKEMDIKVDAFIGNSIGAIVAGFLAQGEDDKLEEIGHNIGLDFIVNMPEEFVENGEFKLDSAKLSGFKKFYQSTKAKKGLDTGPLQKLLKTNLDETKIRKSGNDLGVATYSISDMKPKEVYIEDMEDGRLIDYLLASSAFPGFERPEIAGKKYIDGGVFDNVPYTMAQKRGYKRIIVIDISGLGVKRKLNMHGGQIVYVKNSINMGGVLNFDKAFLENFATLGYLDTLRTFGKLHGYGYFLVPNNNLEKQFKVALRKEKSQAKLSTFVDKYISQDVPTFSLALKELFPDYARFERNWLPVFVDCAATALSIEQIKLWHYKDLVEEIHARHLAVNEKVEALSEKGVKYIELTIRERLKEKKLIEEPYFYYLLIDRFIPEKARKILKKGLFALFPELAAGHFFISEIDTLWKS